jgi:FkbM family methyltransferase
MTMGKVVEFGRIVLSYAMPAAVLRRGPALRGTRFLADAALRARRRGARPFQMVNVGACDGVLYDDVTPWLHRIPNARAVLVEPIPHNQERLRRNYPDETRFVIEKLAVTAKPGRIGIRTFDAAALASGDLPMEFVGCSSVTDSNLMSGKDAWGVKDDNFERFDAHLTTIEVRSDTLQAVLDRNAIETIDAFLVDCEGADWTVFSQLDLARYRPGLIKIEIGALSPEEIGNVIVKLKTGGYDVGVQAEDVWAFPSA